MRRNFLYGSLGLAFLALNGIAFADDIYLPAGTLLHCTLDEPNLSTNTLEEGDPILCRVNALPQFGRAPFPRGAYLMGHLGASKDPGHFVGKGYLRLEFDSVGLPNTELPISGKVIAVRGYRVNRQGDIVGHGHPKRDAVEWLLPPLWTWKVLTLPARGPRPRLKPEAPLTLRLMSSVAIPQASDSSGRSFGKPSPSRLSPQSFANPRTSSVMYLPPAMPVAERQSIGASVTPLPAAESNSSPGQQLVQYTLFVLKNQSIYAARDYWLEDDRLIYILLDGTQRTADLSDVDWGETMELNSQRGARLRLRTGRHAN
jgi:hypothetical protein